METLDRFNVQRFSVTLVIRWHRGEAEGIG